MAEITTFEREALRLIEENSRILKENQVIMKESREFVRQNNKILISIDDKLRKIAINTSAIR